MRKCVSRYFVKGNNDKSRTTTSKLCQKRLERSSEDQERETETLAGNSHANCVKTNSCKDNAIKDKVTVKISRYFAPRVNNSRRTNSACSSNSNNGQFAQSCNEICKVACTTQPDLNFEPVISPSANQQVNNSDSKSSTKFNIAKKPNGFASRLKAHDCRENESADCKNLLENGIRLIRGKRKSTNTKTKRSKKRNVQLEDGNTFLIQNPNVDPFASPKSYFKPRWKPPRSPHNLIEEDFYDNPWGLLIATIFLNKTSCFQARPVIYKFLEDFPNPGTVLKKKPADLEKYFEFIGLRKRATQIWKMTYDFVYKPWKRARELYGVGKYAEDAFRIFCLGDLNTQPTDRFLKIYLHFAKMKEKENGFSHIKDVSADYRSLV